ncbi:hypothetical protein DRH27_02075 [Candidatus Falkowbacteria bacterium]|nr:MAG: hypothetical protein DRH27_02075 [Candidatus Falkowbacteria bacterium]
MSPKFDPVPLWPNDVEIRVLGLAGEFATGKTLFATMMRPKRTIVYDTETSANAYKAQGFTHVDLCAEGVKEYPTGFTAKNIWLMFLRMIEELKPGQFDVIVIDTVEMLEKGLQEYVEQNPTQYGHTSQTFRKMSGIFWGIVKDEWKRVLSIVSAKCQTLVFTVHLRDEFVNNVRTGKKVPKGKVTLPELATVYLELERHEMVSAAGVSSVPSARVLKSRLAVFPEGLPVEVLPPRMPVATYAAICHYIENPPNFAKLKKAEREVERPGLSADERLAIEAGIASDQASTADAAAARAALPQATASPSPTAAAKPDAIPPTVAPAGAGDPDTEPAAKKRKPRPIRKTKGPKPKPEPAGPATAAPAGAAADNGDDALESYGPGFCSKEQADQLDDLRVVCGMGERAWRSALSKRKANTVEELTTEQADELIAKFDEKIERQGIQGE